jgi:two-component system, cell cycle response regulator DivK
LGLLEKLMKTVLIIEDNDNNMELISFILESSGYQCIKAETGQKGIDLAIEKLPDFILLDVQLPDIDGLAVLKKIRASKADGKTPIIAMTSHAMAGDREALLTRGCNGYIEKPIDPGRVMEQIQEILKEMK